MCIRDRATDGTDTKTMAALIKAKTGIEAEADNAAKTTLNLKPSSTATGKGIEMCIRDSYSIIIWWSKYFKFKRGVQ